MQNITSIVEVVSEDWIDDCEDWSLLDQPWIRYPFMMMYMGVFLVCLFGNLFTILVIATHPAMRTATNYFLANLAVADLFVAVFCILQNMIHIVGFDHGNWPLGEALCYMYVFMLHFVPCLSVGILVCVSIEKYIDSIHLPLADALKRQFIISNTLYINYDVRATALCKSKVDSLVNGILLVSYKSSCCYECELEGCIYYRLRGLVTASFILWFIVPLLMLAFIYTRIGLLLWRSGSSVVINTRPSSESQSSAGNGASWQMSNGRTIVYKQDSLLQVPEDPQVKKRQRDLMESRRKMWSTSPSCNNDWSILLQPLSYICLFLSSAINPILYAFLSKRFRGAASDILYCRKGVLSRMSRSRSRNRTLVSDLPEDSRALTPGPPVIRMMRLR
uniref:G_PROTEIN_RECEP_F1_2 domain-containing protein n=1 Tax=Heterorhabditis bacteriophora TaxID=37862 RepID=A0A1I7XEN8_HETBA